MKRILTLIIAVIILFALAACSAKEEPSTVAGFLLEDFKETVSADPSLSAQSIADKLITNEVITFSGATMPVEEGYLMGFNNVEITGFDEGVMLAPAIGTIPFIGYVFTLSSDTDVNSFVDNLKTSGDLRWNICTEAEELSVEAVENKVFFVMAPKSFEE